jgi:hypothetical protein
MAPLVGGEWAEVKTLVIGDVLPPQNVKGEQIVRTANPSYFSRLADATTFERLALVETQRRAVESAQAVAAVTDGAEWIQKFIAHPGTLSTLNPFTYRKTLNRTLHLLKKFTNYARVEYISVWVSIHLSGILFSARRAGETIWFSATSRLSQF